MKRKFIYIVLSLLLAFTLVSCNKDEFEHNIKVENFEKTVRWQEIKVEFKITGETDEVKIADSSLNVEVYKDDKQVNMRQPSKTSSGYLASFSALDVDTEYDVVITASINHRKVELYREKIRTLLKGGSESDPILISTAADFLSITNADAYYKLTNDIDFDGGEIPQPFTKGITGQFDGDGFAFKNFKVPYITFNGIFGYMTTGSGVVKNLVIDNFTYDNYENIENNTSPSSYYIGLITRELNSNAKIENIEFKNITVNLYTQSFGVRYFGLVAAHNKGTIENIKLENVNFNIHYNNANESQIGGVVAKNYSTGKISKVNYISGDFNVLAEEYSTHYSSVYPASYYGAVVGEGSGKLSEVVSNANVNMVLKDPITGKKFVNVDGEMFTVKAPSIEGGNSTQNVVLVDKTDEVKIQIRNTPTEKIHQVLLNGEDKTEELVENTLTIPAALETIHVKIVHKAIDETAELTLTGNYYKVVSAKLGEEVVYSGVGEVPTTWAYGTVIKIKSTLTSGKLFSLKVNGTPLEVVNNEAEFTILKNSSIEIKHSPTKVIYLGGIGGAISTIENALYLGDFTVDLPKQFRLFEDYRLGAIAGTVYSSADHLATVSSNIKIDNNSDERVIAVKRLVGVLRTNATMQNEVVVNSTIKINNVEVNDGHESVAELPENAFTSEFVKNLLPE